MDIQDREQNMLGAGKAATDMKNREAVVGNVILTNLGSANLVLLVGTDCMFGNYRPSR